MPKKSPYHKQVVTKIAHKNTYLNHLIGDGPIDDKTNSMSSKKNHR